MHLLQLVRLSVWFDTVTKLEIQSTYGGSYTDTTASVTAPTAWDDTTAAANAVLRTIRYLRW